MRVGRLALVTCGELPVPDPDQAIIDRALGELGRSDRAEWVAWDADVDWSTFEVAWIRTPWDYAERHDEFLAWLDRVEGEVTVLNPPAILRWNSHKRYLLEMASAGVATVPTVMLRDPSLGDLDAVLGHHGWAEAVVKPAVSVGAIGASRISIGGGGNATALDEALAEAAPDGEVLVQPFMAGVADGEVSILVLDGEVSHTVRKVPAAGDFRVHEFYGGTEVAHEPTSAELELASAALRAVPTDRTLLYARVDCVADDLGVPRLMELELIEPSLFLPYAPPAEIDRLLRAVLRHLDPV